MVIARLAIYRYMTTRIKQRLILANNAKILPIQRNKPSLREYNSPNNARIALRVPI